MKVKIYDTHVHTATNYYHFDVVIKEATQAEVEAYAQEYLAKIGVDFNIITQNRCLFCHEEVADLLVVENIEKYGYHIIPMKGCPK